MHLLHDGYMIIVDDDEDDIQFLLDILSDSGIDATVSFLSGKDLLDFLQITQSTPALILLDYNMPVMNGLELLQTIRNMEKYRNVPIIIISTGFTQLNIEVLKSAGLTACYPKPFSVEEARTIVKEIAAELKLHERHD